MSIPVCLITGSGSGLGLELAWRLASDFIVVGVSRHPPHDGAWDSIDPARRLHVAGDVADPSVVATAMETCARRGEMRLLVNCAGAGVFGPAGSYTADDVDEALKGNLIGTILFSDRAFSAMKATGGTIVNVMSTAAQVGRVNESVYCAGKWGARGYTESLRLEAKGTSVKIVAVYPGGMNTRFWQHARGPNVDAATFMSPAEVADIIIGALKPRNKAYVSDLIISRG
jgi:uncharacterized protein